ncbi:MAG: YihY/virulence factor BrkB family protein [Planctomycetota bacterium]
MSVESARLERAEPVIPNAAMGRDPADAPEQAEGLPAPERGFYAEHPLQIPPAGWWDVAKRVWVQLGRDQVGLLAAGVAFYALLALAPALAAVVSLFGLFASPALIERQLAQLEGVLPDAGLEILGDQLRFFVQTSDSSLSLGFVVALGVALWSTSRGSLALMGATTVAYDERESRGFFTRTLLGFLITGSAIVAALLSVGLLLATPYALDAVGLSDSTEVFLGVARWPGLVLVALLLFAVIYRFGPSRAAARWVWISPGSALASALWVAGSVGFSLYVSHFGTYNETYGSLGAVAVLMFWLWLSAYVVVLGAELNAELERQTSQDTTRPPEEPMGRRGAVVADQAAARR